MTRISMSLALPDLYPYPVLIDEMWPQRYS
jgi:hypothetical protein